MKRFLSLAAALAVCLFVATAAPAAEMALSSTTGNLLRGTLFKQSGISREGVITIRTSWSIPGVAPTFLYDFDILYGRIDDYLFSYMMSDVAELQFLPMEKSGQPVNVRLRNGVVQKITLSSDDKMLFGPVNLRVKDVSVSTENYGENIVPLGELDRIVFQPATPLEEETVGSLVGKLGKALEIGRRDGLVNDDFLVVLDNLESKLKSKLAGEPR